MGKAPALAGAFFDSVLIIADWVKLLRHVDVVCLHGVRWFGGLTRVFAGFFAGDGVRRDRIRLGLGSIWRIVLTILDIGAGDKKAYLRG
jgi:hypothetical protein